MKWYQFLLFDTKKQVKSCILNMEHECKWKLLSLIGFWITIHLLYCWISEHAILLVTISSSTKITMVAGVTFLFSISEMVVLATVIRIIFPKQEKTFDEGLAIVYLSHFSATFLLNFLMISTGIQANHLVFALEPLATLLISHICIGEPLNMLIYVAILALTIGAVGIRMSLGDLQILTDKSLVLNASLMILLCCRNIVLRHVYTMSGQIKMQLKTYFGTILAMYGSLLVILMGFFEFNWGMSLSRALIAWGLHVSYTAITWTILLKQLSPVSIAIITLSGHFLPDTLMKMPVSALQDIITWISLIVFMVGLICYYFHSSNSLTYERNLSLNEMFTRLEFVVFLTIILALFLYTLPPKVSARDLNNIQYLRLDLFLRKFVQTNQVSS